MRPDMISMDSMNDTWEKLGNAINPKPPFVGESSSAPILWALLVLLAISLAVTRSLFVRSATFSFGVALFANPWLKLSHAWLEANRSVASTKMLGKL